MFQRILSLKPCVTIGYAIIKFIFKHSEFSKKGRLYDRGKASDKDLRRNIIQDIVEQGGDFVKAYLGNFAYIARKHRIKYDAVRKVWIDFFLNGNTTLSN